jgi:uncharacterized Zn-binding protein involved in type VI secretion
MPLPDPVATYGARVMPKGYRITGDQRSGLQAVVPYFVPWSQAANFTNAIINPIYTTVVGLITFHLPYQLPTAVCATPVYAQSFEVVPCGIDPELNVATVLPNRGLAPGEYFEWAIVTVTFNQIPWTFQGTDDPQNLSQLDPSNPITLCEQSVKMGGKMVTRKGSNYVYTSSGNPVIGDVGVLVPECKLVLKFPHVPYLPWQLLQPYVTKVNSAPVLGCPAGTLLMESPDTTAKASLNSVVSVEQAVTLEFAFDANGWNNLPQPNGVFAAVSVAGSSGTQGIYGTADFTQIFNYLQFTSD